MEKFAAVGPCLGLFILFIEAKAPNIGLSAAQVLIKHSKISSEQHYQNRTQKSSKIIKRKYFRPKMPPTQSAAVGSRLLRLRLDSALISLKVGH